MTRSNTNPAPHRGVGKAGESETMRTIFGPARRGSLRVALHAIAGYVGVLGLGWFVSSRLSGGDSVADLGLAALTIVVLAPLAGLIGAAMAFVPYRRRKLSRDDATLFWSAAAIVLTATGAVSVWLDFPYSVNTLLMGSIALVVMRVALAERHAQHQRRSP
jgi:hypothetical protein